MLTAALFINQQFNVTLLYIIIPCIIIRTLFIKKYMKFDWFKSLWVGTVLNEISPILVGLIAIFSYIPLLIIEAILPYIPPQLIFTFSPIHLVVTEYITQNVNIQLMCYLLMFYIFILTFSILADCGMLNILFEKKAKDTYKWLMYSNVLIITPFFLYIYVNIKT